MYNEVLGKALTKRETEVLAFMKEGLTNKEIAEKLIVTHHTSKSHVGSILHKFGVKTRAAAVNYALTHDYAKCE